MKMGRQLLLFMIVVIVMGGCGNVITEDQLIGGTWLVTNGYEDGEIGGDPVCPGYEEGMEFIDEEKVYVIAEEKEISYSLSESDEGMEIIFFYPNGEIDFFTITMEKENGFGLNGSGVSKTRNCYFERQE
ncbi:hypothetical protein [Pseudogracilibacillus sp. SO30301A]|uniref:hypothetical protein n=1 Tax=Pseudogracilibacillus sp. SO30301A TaxID=3098291 RepID=UPI00300E588A